MFKYIYKNKKTGKKIYSNIKQDNKELLLVRAISNVVLKNSKIVKK